MAFNDSQETAARDITMKDTIGKSLGVHILQLARLHRARTAELLKDLGLFPGQERVLQVLGSQQAMTMGDLAVTLRVRPPTISKTIGRLSAQGLVERRGSESDARVVHVGLTSTGLERAAMIGAIWERIEDELTEGLDGKDRRRLKKSLKKASKNLSQSLGNDGDVADDIDDEDDET
jgi:DNA-binding MarR family transcriptional regulator